MCHLFMISLFLLFAALFKVSFCFAMPMPMTTLQPPPPLEKTQEDDYFTVDKFVPTNIEEGAGSAQIERRMLDKSISSLWQSPVVKESSVGKAAKTVDDGMKQGLEIQADKPHEISHKIDMQFRAFEQMAQFRYKGFFEGNANFYLATNAMRINVQRRVFERTDLVYSHHMDPNTEVMNEFQVRWDW